MKHRAAAWSPEPGAETMARALAAAAILLMGYQLSASHSLFMYVFA